MVKTRERGRHKSASPKTRAKSVELNKERNSPKSTHTTPNDSLNIPTASTESNTGTTSNNLELNLRNLPLTENFLSWCSANKLPTRDIIVNMCLYKHIC